MKKKNKIRVKKKPLVILLALIVVAVFDIYMYFDSTSYKLKKKGYTKDNIEIMNKVLDDSSKKIVSSLGYNKNVMLLLNDKNFNVKKFDEYLKFYDNDNIDYDEKIILIINDKYYLSRNYERYIRYYNLNKKYNSRQIVENINCNLDRDYYNSVYDVDLKKENLMLVNKYNKLNEKYAPKNLVTIENKYGYSKKISKDAYDAYILMFNDAQKKNVSIYITSAFRDYNYQYNLYNNYVKSSGKKEADRFSARAGYSEHQTGLAIDISSKDTPYTKFKGTDEYEWMLENCYKYGYILRYPEGKESQTGYMFESWHYRYVGKKVAEYIHRNNITYDEYYEYFIK